MTFVKRKLETSILPAIFNVAEALDTYILICPIDHLCITRFCCSVSRTCISNFVTFRLSCNNIHHDDVQTPGLNVTHHQKKNKNIFFTSLIRYPKQRQDAKFGDLVET